MILNGQVSVTIPVLIKLLEKKMEINKFTKDMLEAMEADDKFLIRVREKKESGDYFDLANFIEEVVKKDVEKLDDFGLRRAVNYSVSQINWVFIAKELWRKVC